MSFGFWITTDDVEQVVASRFGRVVECDDAVAEELFDLIDKKAVEKAALQGDDLEDQTEGAHQEIERQMRESPKALSIILAAPAAP